MAENKLMKKHICPVCGREFETNRTDAKTCSPKCRQAVYRANKGTVEIETKAKKRDTVKVGVVETENGLEFRYPQKVIKGELAKEFIHALNILIANTEMSMDDYLYRRVSGSVDDIINLSKRDIESQKRVIELILVEGESTIEIACSVLYYEETERMLKEAKIKHRT